MKRICIIALTLALCCSINAQIPDKFIGRWNSFCADAQDGYQYTTMEIKKDTVLVIHKDDSKDDSFVYTCEWVVLGSDTLRFRYNPLLEVVVYMHFDDASNPIGVAWWDEGVTLKAPLVITRRNVKE